MTHVVVIGSTGHVGTYLVPRLVEAGYEVTAVSRGQRAPYQPHPAWNSVRQVTLDRVAEDRREHLDSRFSTLSLILSLI